MRIVFLSVVFLFVFLHLSNAQRKEGFYNTILKETAGMDVRFYYKVEKKDSLWQKEVYFVPEKTLFMSGTYLDSNCKNQHGKFYYFYANRKLEATGEYNNNKLQGLWLSYHPNGAMQDSVYYDNGQKTGICLKWFDNGFVADSAVYNKDGSGFLVSWFDNGHPAAAGNYAAGSKKQGKWQFFYKSGKVSSVEMYEKGKLMQRQYYDENGTPTTDTIDKERKFSFAGKETWAEFLGRNVDATIPANRRAPAGLYTVFIRFSIDIDGNAVDVIPVTQLGYGMEDEAVRVIKKSKWLPAIEHGRRVKTYHTQPVSFIIRG